MKSIRDEKENLSAMKQEISNLEAAVRLFPPNFAAAGNEEAIK